MSPQPSEDAATEKDPAAFQSAAFRVRRAVLVVESVRGGKRVPRTAFCAEGQVRAQAVKSIYQPLAKLFLSLYMMSYVVAVPGYCWLDPTACGDSNVVHRSPFALLIPEHIMMPLEIFLLCGLLVKTGADRYIMGEWSPGHRLASAVILLALLDCCLYYVNGSGIPPPEVFWSPLLRPFIFLGLNRCSQRFLAVAMRAMAQSNVVDLLATQAVFFGVWAWFGLLLFTGTAEGDAFFRDFLMALRSLFIMFTTANYPDIMMIAYRRCRLVFIYFFTFQVVSLYILFNVLLAALFAAYKAHVRLTRSHTLEQAEEGLAFAFRLLADTELETECANYLSLQTWRAFFVEFCYGANAKWNEERSDNIFRLLDEDGDGYLSLQEWYCVCRFLANPDINMIRESPAEIPDRVLNMMVVLHALVDTAIVVSLSATLVETHIFITRSRYGLQYGWRSHWEVASLQVLCCTLYLVEIMFRMAILGFVGSWGYRNIVDATMAVACSLLESLVYMIGAGLLSSSYLDKDYLYRVLALIHVARVERLLFRMKRVRSLVQVLLRLVSSFRGAVTALFFVFYLYSTLGVQLFGGRIRTDSPSLQKLAFATAGPVGYFDNNFNDFASGLVVLFELMVVNNWFVIAEGLAAVRPDTPWLGWVFCASFYVCIHTVILNILITSVVESYGRLKKQEVPGVALGGSSGDARVDAGVPDAQGVAPSLRTLRWVDDQLEQIFIEPTRAALRSSVGQYSLLTCHSRMSLDEEVRLLGESSSPSLLP